MGYGVALISHDTVEALAKFAGREAIRYTMLSDAAAEIIPAFGVANERFPKGSQWYGVAHPLILAVDSAGIVRHRFSTRDHRERPEIDSVLAVLRGATGG